MMESAVHRSSCVALRQSLGIGFAPSTLTLVALACLLVRSPALQGEVRFVPSAAYPTIQAAVDASLDGDTILLSPGTYTGRGNSDIDVRGKAIAIRSSNPDDPNIVAATVIDCASTVQDPHRGFDIMDCNGAEISGLTITHGLASTGGALYCLRSSLDITRCRIIENAARAGSADTDLDGGAGGGLYCQESTVWLIACVIAGNKAGDGAASNDANVPGGMGGSGGGICSVLSNLRLVACTVSGNTAGAGGDNPLGVAGAGGAGGGVYADAVVVTDSTISYNRAGAGGQGPQGGQGGRGGGLGAEAASVTRCIIEGNQAGAGGAERGTAVGTPKADPNVPGSPSIGGAAGDGGGVCAVSADIANSLVTGNRAGRAYAAGTNGLFKNGDGGGIWAMAGEVRQCTVAGNLVFWRDTSTEINVAWAAGLGAGVFCARALPISNSILSENTPVQMFSPDCNSIAYSAIVAGMCPAPGSNLEELPLFVRSGSWVDANDPNRTVEPDDPNAMWVSGDYRLQALSPCIDAGNPRYVPNPNETDLDGRPRLLDAAVDMGAYEFRSLVPVYRFWAGTAGKHFYTLKESEKNKLLDQFAFYWAYEGIVYYAYLRPAEPNLSPVFRFWAPTLGRHFYTIDEAEKDGLLKESAGVWTFEGPVFYAWPEGRQPADAQAVHQFWSDSLQSHFYTIDEAEKDKLINVYSQAWSYRGVAWYAYQTVPGSEAEPKPEPTPEPPAPATPNPIAYEFTGGADCALYTVRLKAYVDGREAGIDSPELVFVAQGGQASMVVDLGSSAATLNQFHLQSSVLEHAATIRDSNSAVEIPFVVNAVGSFDTTAVHGPYGIDPQKLAFPVAEDDAPGAAEEAFSILGSVTLDGRKLEVDLEIWATGFAAMAGKAVLDTSGLPDRLDARLDKVFQWSRQEHEDLLLETTVKEHAVQLYVVFAQVQATGLWTGRRTP